MRGTILVWSAVSGLLLGLFAGAALLGVLAVGAAVLPASLTRLAERVRTPAVVVCLVVLPLIGAAIGYLEGRLKLR